MGTACIAGIANVLNANITGNGTQTLVLAHGLGTDHTVWNYLIPVLACYFKVLVFDLAFSPNIRPPGGINYYDPNKYSTLDGYADDLVCLLDQLNLKKTIYLGHSMSAMIGCIAATNRPELFHHLILLSGSPRYLNEEGYKGGFNRSEVDEILGEIREDYSGWVHTFAPYAIIVNDTAAIAKFESSLLRIKPNVTLSVAKTVFLNDFRWVLPRVRVPNCTIIQSKNDHIVPTSVASYMKRNLGTPSQVKILNTEGHFPQLTAYCLLLDVLKDSLSLK
ncbi:Alpha/Beta hydrolase fold [Sesbania bispinosa]|nr:Alpha/Beta hydrolase fold [Sesbania bispinosa]